MIRFSGIPQPRIDEQVTQRINNVSSKLALNREELASLGLMPLVSSTWWKATWRGKVFHLITLRSHSITDRSQSRNSRKESEGRNSCRCYSGVLLTGMLFRICSVYLFYTIKNHLPRLDPPSSIKKVHHRIPHNQNYWEQFLN